MEGSGRYGRHVYSRRRSSANRGSDAETRRRTVKLIACAAIFLLAAFTRVLFPGFFAAVGEKLTAGVDYKTALTILGEGISGERKFISAVGEAFTYAFKTASDDEPDGTADSNTPAAAEAFSEYTPYPPVRQDTDDISVAGSTSGEQQDSLANAVISAFLETQESYSDYTLPAGTTFDMPILGTDFTAPVSGAVSSSFGYRMHPVDGVVKFHYGTDIAVDEGTSISAFADGNVISVGESASFGKFVMINHNGTETRYAHCNEIFVTAGQAVKMGEQIALSGSTGNATAPCLHFELRIEDVAVNSEYYVKWQ